MEKTILTTSEAARLLGVSVRTAQMLIEGGALTSWKTPGGHRRVYRRDVLAIRSKNDRTENRSARIAVVTSPEHVERLKAAVSVEGHSVNIYTDVYSAALALGLHAPALVLIDLSQRSKEITSFLESLATNQILNSLKIAVLGKGKAIPTGDYDVRRVTVIPELEMLPRILRSILDDDLVTLHTVAEDATFPVSPNERQRLAALERSRLVDSAAEDVFDRITWLASHSLRAPIALFTTLTSNRQWFKSRQGLDIKETPRSWAFCNYTILQRDVLTIGNMTRDSRFANNPAVVGNSKFRFYAGVPVVDGDGFALGSLCVIDRKARTLDPGEIETLRSLAYLTSDAVQSRSDKFRLQEI